MLMSFIEALSVLLALLTFDDIDMSFSIGTNML